MTDAGGKRSTMKNKRITCIVLAVSLFLIAGCGEDKGESITDHIKDNITSGSPKEIEQKERVDAWEAKKALSDLPSVTLTLDPEEATSVQISFSEEEEKREWESYTGGADADFARASISGEAPEATEKIIDEYNAWVDRMVEEELVLGRERWELYHASDPDSFIALTPRIGMELMRSDTRVISFVTRISRYNRDYEPDDYWAYGHTYDAQTGEELSLSDLVSDTGVLTECLCEALLTEKHGNTVAEEHFAKEAFSKRVKESIEGVRDDGLFAWCVSPVGFEFYLSDPFFESEYLQYDSIHTVVPFACCNDILKQEIDTVPYDHVTAFSKVFIPDIYGCEAVLPEEKDGSYYTTYDVLKNGVRYLYLCGEEETLVFRLEEEALKYLGDVPGEVKEPYNGFTCYRNPDPDDLKLEMYTMLVREMQLSAKACVGDDGFPERLDYFYSEVYNVEPMSVIKPFEAEVFENEQDETPEKKMLEPYLYLSFLRSDGETYIDMETEPSADGKSLICRLYVEGDYENGWIVNGHPVDDICNLQGWLEE